VSGARRGTAVAPGPGSGRRTGVSKTSNRRPATPLPHIFRWTAPHNPLPLRAVRVPPRSRPHRAPPAGGPPQDTGPFDRPFDFCGHVRRLCADVVRHTPELGHIDVSRLLFAVTQARSGLPYGLQARVTPLRFRHGHLTRVRRSVAYQVQRYFVDGTEVLYLVTFCLPRFLDQDFDDKFVTLFHELYHISPGFEGDLRRHDGRYDLHSHSKRLYDQHMAQMARSYLTNGADRSLHGFLQMSFAQLQQRHGSVVGVVVPRPRLLPVPPDATLA
jgi:predicted metallopeptidase